MSLLILPGIVEPPRGRKDKTWTIPFSTQELTPEQASQVMLLNQKYCFIAISEDPFTQAQHDQIEKAVEAAKDLDIPGKSSAQRLRGVFYKLFEQNNEGYKDFPGYYESKMEYVIEFYKNKIEP